jgi:hypothetical protein
VLAAHYALQVLQEHHALIALQDSILMVLEAVFHAQVLLILIVKHAQAFQLALFALQATLVVLVLHAL